MRSTPDAGTPSRRWLSISLGLALAATVAMGAYGGAAEAAISRAFKPGSTITLAPGIEYSKGTMRTSGGLPQSVRVATVDPEHPDVRLRALLSNGLVVKREVVSRIAKRFSGPGMEAMVATNGDMSQRDAVDAYAAPQGMHVAAGELMVAQACTRPTLGIDSSGVARIGDVRVNIEMVVPGRVPRRVLRLNTHRDDTSAVLYTRAFATSTRTRPGGIEVVLDLERRIGPSDAQEVRVLKVRRGAGNTRLRAGQAVLSMKGPRHGWIRGLKAGQRLQLVTTIVRNVDGRCGGTFAEAAGWDGTVEALGGNHFTLRNGSIKPPSKSHYPSGSQRHPRTGVGVTPDGRVLMVTVDGRRPGYSVGVTLAEMGRLMQSLGARHAFNLDGGGSTNMGRRYASGQFRVANRPSDGRERPATQALGAFAVREP